MTKTAAGVAPVEPTVGLVPERAVAIVTECEACFTPDVCQLRGTCDHYRAELLRVAARADHDCALERGSVMCRECDLNTIAAHSKTPNVRAKPTAEGGSAA